MPKPKVTRGYGLLETFLAKRRVKMANKLIPSYLRKGRILDVGSGFYPLFLLNTDFAERYGLDQIVQPDDIERFKKQKIILFNQNVENNEVLPFDNGYFSAVTMLAVLEHIELKKLVRLLDEIYRVLCPDGIFVITTPARWAENTLKAMTKLHLISPVELEEHKRLARRSAISTLLQEANFSKENLRFGYFEMFMNIWATATK